MKASTAGVVTSFRYFRGLVLDPLFFDGGADRLVNSPFYWYFFAYLDLELMGLSDPAFLVPSTDFHKLAAPILRDGVWRFSMAASMEPKSRDRWNRYRVKTLELGRAMVEISENLKRNHAVPMPPEGVLSAPGVIFVGRR